MIEILKKYYILLIFSAVVLVGIVIYIFIFQWENKGVDAYEPNIYELGGEIVSREYYNSIKVDIIGKIKNGTIRYNEVEKFRNIANREVSVCNIKLKDVNSKNLLVELIKQMELCVR